MEKINHAIRSLNIPKPNLSPLPRSTDCPICKGIGYISYDLPVGHPEFGRAYPCPCRTGEGARELAKLSGLTEKERELRLSMFRTSGRPGTADMLKACRSFVEDPVGILTLWGGVGVGKTMCLQAVVNGLIERGVMSVYVTAFDLFSHIREAFNAQREVVSESAYNRLARFERVRMLALDEMDKVRPTDWMLEQMTNLMDKRHRRGLDGKNGTLLALNTDPALLNDWIASRLMDGRNRAVHNADADLRPVLKRRREEA